MHLQESTAHACKGTFLLYYSCLLQPAVYFTKNAKLTASELVPNEQFSAPVGTFLMFHSFDFFFPPTVIFALLGERDWLSLNMPTASLCTQEQSYLERP